MELNNLEAIKKMTGRITDFSSPLEATVNFFGEEDKDLSLPIYFMMRLDTDDLKKVDEDFSLDRRLSYDTIKQLLFMVFRLECYIREYHYMKEIIGEYNSDNKNCIYEIEEVSPYKLSKIEHDIKLFKKFGINVDINKIGSTFDIMKDTKYNMKIITPIPDIDIEDYGFSKGIVIGRI